MPRCVKDKWITGLCVKEAKLDLKPAIQIFPDCISTELISNKYCDLICR